MPSGHHEDGLGVNSGCKENSCTLPHVLCRVGTGSAQRHRYKDIKRGKWRQFGVMDTTQVLLGRGTWSINNDKCNMKKKKEMALGFGKVWLMGDRNGNNTD